MKLSWWEEEIDLLAHGTPPPSITVTLAESGALAAVPDRSGSISSPPRDEELDFTRTHRDRRAACALPRGRCAARSCSRPRFRRRRRHARHARTLGAAIVNARTAGYQPATPPRAARSPCRSTFSQPPGWRRPRSTGDWPPQALDLLARLGSDARAQACGRPPRDPPAECPQLQSCLIMAAVAGRPPRRARCSWLRAHERSTATAPRLWIAWRAARGPCAHPEATTVDNTQGTDAIGSLADRAVLVTGAGDGIGRAVAIAAAAHWRSRRAARTHARASSERTYDDIVNAQVRRDPRSASSICAHPRGRTTRRCEAASSTSTDASTDSLHCAGLLGRLAPVEHIDPATWMDVMQVNVNAGVPAHESLPAVAASRGGCLDRVRVQRRRTSPACVLGRLLGIKVAH